MLKLASYSLVLMVFIHFTLAKENTIIMQNGLNGYEGFKDAHVYRTNYARDSANLNYGQSPYLLIHREDC